MGWQARAWARSLEADAEAEVVYTGAARADTVAAKAVRAALARLEGVAVEIQVRLLSEPRSPDPSPGFCTRHESGQGRHRLAARCPLAPQVPCSPEDAIGRCSAATGVR